MKVQPEEVIASMEQLSVKLSHNHPSSETARYVAKSLKELKNSHGTAFTGALQSFFNFAPSVNLSDRFSFTVEEKALWDKVFSFKQLGNNLWPLSL